ncbi:MAG: inorganic phosphate transporter [Candidatus Lokiarchaeota archaeon]|nr:inorganic phosphate transporter [Candidatus Lokiarchaeota archaeon]
MSAITPIIIVFIVISLIIAFAIGANDETFATVYGSRTLSMRQILILATIFAVFGALILGEAVSETVGGKVLEIEITDAITITVLLSTTIWLLLSSALGLPISTTHATMGSIIGIGLLPAVGGSISGIAWTQIVNMSFWWILSPLIGYVVTYITYKVINKRVIQKLDGFQKFESTEKKFAIVLLAVICWTAFSRAGNDCSNAVGIVYGATQGNGSIDITAFLFVIGLSFALGIVVLARGLIKNVGTLTELRPSTAFASEIPTAIILFIGTIFGIPLSGSHMLVASLIGLGKAQHAPKNKNSKKIVLIWILTFPMAAIVAVILYFPISWFVVI